LFLDVYVTLIINVTTCKVNVTLSFEIFIFLQGKRHLIAR